MIEIFSCGEAFFTSFVWVWLCAQRYCIHHIIDVLLASSQSISILSRNLSICDYAWNWCKKQVVARIDHISNFAYRRFFARIIFKTSTSIAFHEKISAITICSEWKWCQKKILKGNCNKSWELKQWASLWINKTRCSGLRNSNKNKHEHGMKWAHMQMRRHGNVADEKEKPSHTTRDAYESMKMMLLLLLYCYFTHATDRYKWNGCRHTNV